MTEPADLILHLGTSAATDALAERIAASLCAGDTILLSGGIGAGKTHLARAVIRALQRRAGEPPEDIPSPTFTLVQTYAAGPLEIWHADLYRLHDPQEIEELGLVAAFDTALCLVEWPDRLGPLEPGAAALHLHLALCPESPEARRLIARGPARLVTALSPPAA